MVYAEYLKKSSHGYECSLCSTVQKNRRDLYQHLKRKHGILDNSEKSQESKEKLNDISLQYLRTIETNEMTVLEKEHSMEAKGH